MVQPRHIQDFANASALEPHWGYADRVLPCTNDAGSCAYLDLVYSAHDRGMLYSGIMYAILGGILLLWAFWHRLDLRSRSGRPMRTVTTVLRRYTLPEARSLRAVFGRVTRLQIILLAGLSAYLLVFSFVGMTYRKWVTPVKNMPGVHNTRTSLGPFADRVGILAYALTPISILLASRESLLSTLTGVPYQHFNFLHRWIGHIIMLQSVVHTIGWCIVEVRLYQPQPAVGAAWIKQLYMIAGVVAFILLILLWVLATPWCRRAFGYEFFRKAHWVLAMLFVGACWCHWAALKCFMIPSLVLWVVDRGIRLARTALIHYRLLPGGHGQFSSFPACVTHYDTDVIRLDLDLPPPFTWHVGQHYYLTFPRGSMGGIWQSHPFTPLSLPGEQQSYLIRAKRGETKRIADAPDDTVPVILTGPYGSDITRDLSPMSNVLCIAGGTGITYVLPVLLRLAQLKPQSHVQLIWVIRHARDTKWIGAELARLLACSHISVLIHSSREGALSSSGPVDEERKAVNLLDDSGSAASVLSVIPEKPDLSLAIAAFLKRVCGPTKMFVSGPPDMVTTVREKVARCNDGGRVWRGEDEYEVDLVTDERLE